MAQPQSSNQPSTFQQQPFFNNYGHIDHANSIASGQNDGRALNFHLRNRDRSRSPDTTVTENMPIRTDLVEQAAVTAALLQSARALPKAIDAKRTIHLSSLSVAEIAHDIYARNIAKALPPLVSPPFPTIAAKASAKASAKAPARASAQTSVKAPARASAQTSAKVPAMSSAKTSAKAPSRASAKTSAKAPTRASAKTSAKAPTRA